MPELKTWKNLLDERVITQEQYKRGQAEAIKWFKIMKGGSPDRSLNNSEIWIKHFFNLTEEGLEAKE